MNRRDFVSGSVKAGIVAGLADLSFLQGLQPVPADEARPKKVQFGPDTEPLVRLLEDTSRDKLLETVAAKIRDGLSYQRIMTALMLAGVRGIQPRPVGFKFHAVLVVNSAHLASLAAPDTDRWLPLFWALDNFKKSQEQNKKEGDWSMAPVDEAKLPSATQAKERFVKAMDEWDEEGADQAVTALVRGAGAEEIIELFWRLGCRDFRDIGHKAIYVANAWRTMQTIGWRHAEPVMRSLAYALLEREGDDNPAKHDHDADRPGRENLKRLTKIRAGWQRGKVDAGATTDLLATLRSAKPAEACDKVVALLNKETDPSSVWDGLFLAAGELLMRQPGIVGIHCVTSVNALHFGYQTSGHADTRKLLMLQAAAFLPMFRAFMLKRGKLNEDLSIDKLEEVELKSSGAAALEEIFADASKDHAKAARKTLALLQAKGDPQAFMTAARRLIFSKGTDSHDYKFSSAALEDFFHASPAWRNRLLASSMFKLRGSGDRDNGLVKRTKAALGA